MVVSVVIKLITKGDLDRFPIKRQKMKSRKSKQSKISMFAFKNNQKFQGDYCVNLRSANIENNSERERKWHRVRNQSFYRHPLQSL